IAEIDGRPVGFKVGYERHSGQFYSWMGGVVPEFRRRGIATELLVRQHTWAREAGFDSVRTKTTNESREMLILNLERGFEVVGTELDRENDVKIVLKKRL
ncbi:MAG: GNAT family N-acetyltransferase, partial [Bradymonadaceae bacterium]